MKTNKLFIGLGLLVAFAMLSCEDALNVEPETYYNENQVFSTEEGVETAVSGMWSVYNAGAYNGTSYHTFLNPLSGRFYSNQGASKDATSLNCSPINTWLQRMWPNMYSTINNANIIIANIDKEEVTLNNKNTSLGQAYFLRAITYFDLVRLFGDVPLRIKPGTFEDLHLSRAEKAMVYDLIIEDLNKAAQLLPERGEYRPERPLKYAANAYLAKVYMTMAGEDEGNPSYWENAFEEASKVVGQYNLVPSYIDLFDINLENSNEAILELNYGHVGAGRSTDAIRSYVPKKHISLPSTITTFGRIRANKEVFDSHVNQYPGDPRIDVTYIYNEYARSNGGVQKLYPAKKTGNDGWPCIGKYIDPSYNGTTTERNFIKLRYADVLLMLAEIENELNGPANAYQYVNQVLARARNTGGTTIPEDWSGMTQEQFRDRIMQERKFELLAEGHDWFDTRRRGYTYFLNEIIEKHNNAENFDSKKDYIYPVSIKNMLLPIPLDEISGNQEISQADQNPGY